MTGEINGAPFRIIVPATWNGKLLVFAHGYVDKADHQGEVDQRPTFPAPSPATAAALLGQGWALAATAYKDNGWAVKEALDDLVALTSYFKDSVAKPDRTYLWGFSMGSVPTLRLAERNGGAFDGYIAGCSVSAGTPRGGDWLLATMLAYDVTFGEPASWGTPGNVRDDIDFDTEVLPVLLGQLASFGKFEFIRLVAGTPGRGLVVPPPPAFFPGWVFQDFFFATEAGAELERRAGGPVVQNLTHTYTLTPAETAYLMSLGVDPGPLLAAMNASRNIAAPPSSRNYVEHYAEFDGTIKKPVIALHTEIDGLVPVSARVRLRGHGRGSRYVRPAVPGVHDRGRPLRLQHHAAGHHGERAGRVGGERREADERRLPGKSGLRPELRSAGLAAAVAR